MTYRKVELFSWLDPAGNRLPMGSPRRIGTHFQFLAPEIPQDGPDVPTELIAAILARPTVERPPGGNRGTLVKGTPRTPKPMAPGGAAVKLPAILRP